MVEILYLTHSRGSEDEIWSILVSETPNPRGCCAFGNVLDNECFHFFLLPENHYFREYLPFFFQTKQFAKEKGSRSPRQLLGQLIRDLEHYASSGLVWILPYREATRKRNWWNIGKIPKSLSTWSGLCLVNCNLKWMLRVTYWGLVLPTPNVN